MLDLMFKATDKAAWDAWLESLDDETKAAILIDEIGPIIITPAVIDTDGEITTPAVMDAKHHVNVRVMSDAIDAAALAAGGTGVTWVDPATVETPSREWAGGMNYWVPAVGGGNT